MAPPHVGFLFVAVSSLLDTLQVMAWRWWVQGADVARSSKRYVSGYFLIGAALALYPIVQSPLFVHGFVPSIGTEMIVVALAMGGTRTTR